MSHSNANEGIVFSDDDDDDEGHIDEVKNEVQMRLQENTEVIVRTFKEFLSTPSFINNRGDISTNIVDIYNKKCYNISENKIRKFFKIIEIIRRKKLKSMLYEKQNEYSGIMLDFDIKTTNNGNSLICDTHYHRLCTSVLKVIFKYLKFKDSENGQKRDIFIAFTKKPKPVYDAINDYWKDGIHMLIPGIKITREFKKLIILELINSKVLEKVFKEINPHKTLTRSDFLDINSAHVGVFFLGSASKINTPPYELVDLYKVQITIGDFDDLIPVKTSNLTDINANSVFELSLNWENSKNRIIEKIKYYIKPMYQNLLEVNKKSIDNDFDDADNDQMYGEMSMLKMHDTESDHIKSLLDILNSKRSEEYKPWFDVLCALAHTSVSYKPLGEYFSRKCVDKFNLASFESCWNGILHKKTNNLTISSIHYWARLDNPDRYEEVKHRNLFNILYKKIYDAQVEGNLEHFDVAEILYQVLKDKYVYDKNNGISTWYEFILENEPMKLGELYKWRAYIDRPNSILKYVSTILPNLFRKVLDKIKKTMDENNTELAKYHYVIYKNFQKSCRALKNSNFKKAVVSECEQLFEKLGFSDKLDSDPNIKGVANGIIQLGKQCHLIQGFHGHCVSKFTTAKYKKMNPNDASIKKVLIALRNLFPDNEPDTFDYMMHYLASTLDGNKKESIMMLLVGKGSNGKSFLVELHKGAIGEAYGVKMPLSFLTSRAKDAESATPALMQLKDAHFAYYSESNKFEVLNMAKIKEFTGQETLAGRKLHSDYVNFKPKCHHLVSSNNDFEIHGTDHGTWRRLDYVTMKIKFCNLSTDEYDSSNPYERVADPTLGSNWTEDEDMLAAYLGILVYYYESLQNKYDGKVRNVPHPHIIQETENFRNRQDRINNFLNKYLVKCCDSDFESPMNDVRDKYIKWYESQFPGSIKEYQKAAMSELENSKLMPFIKKTKRDNFLKGYRVLDMSEEKNENEEYHIDIGEKANKEILKIKSETSTQFIERLCHEYNNNSNNNKL